MNKKIKIILLIATVLLLFLIGLFIILGLKKEKINVDDFLLKLEDNSFNVKNITRDYNYDYIKNVYSAEYLDNYDIIFIEVDNKSNSIKLFDNHYNKYINVNGPKSTTLINGLNYNTFTLTTNEYYMYISRVDNTIIYSKSDKKYKEEVKEIIKKIGY